MAPTQDTTSGHRPQSKEEKEEHRQRVLREGTSAIVGNIASAVVIKDEDLVFLTDADGSVPLHGAHGFGLYYRDCRYLSGYELELGGHKPIRLIANGERGYVAVCQFTNPELDVDDRCIHRDAIGVRWERLLVGKNAALHDRIVIQNFSLDAVAFPIRLGFAADFRDVFDIRDQTDERLGRQEPPRWDDATLAFEYVGKDDVRRRLLIGCDPSPDEREDAGATFRIALGPRERCALLVTCMVEEVEPGQSPRSREPEPDYQTMRSLLQERSDAWLARETRVVSDSLVLNRIMEQSQRALGVLQSHVNGHTYFAAGVPWFVALFGRDSLVTALQTLAYDPDIGRETLRLLAQYQGGRHDEWREEQPGKILHELRVGEKARLGDIPHTPYYGTIDATLLFLILLGRHARWTGDLGLFAELRPAVDAALAWMARDGDINGDGYLEYRRVSKAGLENQGWKDSGDAIVNRDGSRATAPIALVEVQAYAYEALTLMSDLYRRSGDGSRADRLRQEADTLRVKFNRDFWMEDRGCYALALQAEGRPVAVVTSNAGHALWSGIADEVHARGVVAALTDDAMFSGWGIRTLSQAERLYNPMGYHLGTVWPHDNSLIAAGFHRYGHDDATMKVFRGLVEAAMHFEGYQLPELFCGFSRDDYPVPVRYPVACHPQAWASASIPYLLQSLLGLDADAFTERLYVRRPLLPEFLSYIELHGLHVGRATIDLRFEGTGHRVSVHVLRQEGPLTVNVEPA